MTNHKITAQTQEDFEEQLKAIIASEDAKKISIVYIWKVEKQIPRVNGKSNVVYIGMSENSFADRYSTSNAKRDEAYNFRVLYKELIALYGPITIEIKQVDKPKEVEEQDLLDYYKEHLELPPLNRRGPHLP